MGALEGCTSLASLNTLDGFRTTLGALGGLRALDVRCQDVGGRDLSAALAHYLPRSCSTLTMLNIRWGEWVAMGEWVMGG